VKADLDLHIGQPLHQKVGVTHQGLRALRAAALSGVVKSDLRLEFRAGGEILIVAG